jgi:phosphohistidine phosphatase
MRRLILMRHAKSSWDEPTLKDHLRPLNDRGRRSATLVGEWLRDHGPPPDHALVSDAVRARQTWDGAAAIIGAAPAQAVADLYAAGPDTMLRVLRQAPDVPTVLMIGHQPGIGAFGRALLRDPPEDKRFAKYPTAATSVIAFDVPAWSEVDWQRGVLEAFVVPRELE